MDNPIRILPPVLDDLVEACDWYDREAYPGLGERFEQTFYAALDTIQQRGGSFRKAHGSFRKLLLKPFPYLVYFQRHEKTWIITLVIHAARDPQLRDELLTLRRFD